MYNDVVRHIFHSVTSLKRLLNSVLINFRCKSDTKTKFLKRDSLTWVPKVVMSRDSSANSYWWKLQFRSNLKIQLPFSLCRISSMLGIWRFCLIMGSLACLLSVHKRISPDCFSVKLTQIWSLGWLNNSHVEEIYKFCRDLLSHRKWILLTCCAAEVTFSFMCNINLKFFTFPTPLKYFSYLVNKSASDKKICMCHVQDVLTGPVFYLGSQWISHCNICDKTS